MIEKGDILIITESDINKTKDDDILGEIKVLFRIRFKVLKIHYYIV